MKERRHVRMLDRFDRAAVWRPTRGELVARTERQRKEGRKKEWTKQEPPWPGRGGHFNTTSKKHSMLNSMYKRTTLKY